MLMYPLPAAPTPHGIERAGGFYGWIPVLNLCQELQLKPAWEVDIQECMHSWAPLTLGNSLAAAGTSLKSCSITETVLERK